MSEIADTPAVPYYAVIFTSLRSEGDNGYAEMADKMVALAATQPGFLGLETAREEIGITVSSWKDLKYIACWKHNREHVLARRMGRNLWYSTRADHDHEEFNNNCFFIFTIVVWKRNCDIVAIC